MLDSKTQEELRARFNPDGSELRKIQLRMLEMLKYIDEVCRENGIKYWLSSGTCLGAVRHGGFIPWDDDVDIEMCAKDYLKFRRVLASKPSTVYQLQEIKTDSSYFYPFAKLRDCKSVIEEIGGHDKNYRFKGLFIDIFVITPSNSIKLRQLSTYLYSALINKNLFSGWLRKSVRYTIIPFLELFQRINANGIYRHISGSYFYKERDRRDFKEILYIRFEDTELPVPSNYRHYLSLIYSDYEKLPDFNSLQPHLSKIRYI